MSVVDFHVIIPARHASARLPGKVLLDILGKPMLQHVYERCVSSGAKDVYIATCDNKIAQVAQDFGAKVIMTADTHTSGTERIIEAVEHLAMADTEIVVNVQGDEPQMPPEAISQVAKLTPVNGMATLMNAASSNELNDPDIVKVVSDSAMRALYFSRSIIPYKAQQHTDMHAWRRHLGIYAYRVSLLKKWKTWAPCALEQLEKLEQLRPLYYGTTIAIADVCTPVPAGVDNPTDLERVRAQCKSQ